MARIPETEVQRLKDEVEVQRLVEAAGIALRRVGKDLAGTASAARWAAGPSTG
jgi:DNA primase